MKVTQSCLFCSPMDYTVHGILQVRTLEWVACPFSRGSSQPRDQTQVSRIAGGFSSLAEPQRKPKNTGVGSLSLLQGFFPTQEWNRGLLHCRWNIYQLSHRESLAELKQLCYHSLMRCSLWFSCHNVAHCPHCLIWQPDNPHGYLILNCLK